MEKYDLIVLGGGTAGLGTAFRASAQGWKVAIVETHYLGGTCINVGCTPSKILISSARAMQAVRDAGKLGVIAAPPTADWKAMVERKERIIGGLRQNTDEAIEKNEQIVLYQGKATFTAPHTIEVNGQSLKAEKIVIATGARPALPPIAGLSDIDYLTSTSAMEMEELPRSLLIVGGGSIALEFSQLFARLGVDVTILYRGPRLAANLEPEISEEIYRVLESEGITLLANTHIRSAGSEDGSAYLAVETEKVTARYSAHRILVATGRAPNTDMLDLEKTGIQTDKKGFIAVDEGFQTNVKGIWAIGDVIGGMMFTHKAWHDALLLSGYLLRGEEIRSSDRLIPFAVFTEPEIAGAGLSENGAVEAGYPVKVQRFSFSHQKRAMAIGKTAGFVKLVLDEKSGRILGAHLIGPEAGELIHELIVAMHCGTTVYDLQEMMHVHPSISEAINSVALSS